jgi:Fe(3+) dicitrate transport protein
VRNSILFLTAFISLQQLIAQQQTTNKQAKKDSIESLSEVIITANKLLGSKFEAKNRTGSAYFLSSEDIQKHNYFDVTRILAEVPGVNIYEEDGFGLRPNISIRGTSPERSSKITIMEDGVLAAPAPYSAPAAYYFPNVARMQSVEVLKGSSQIQYGPFTTGGAINFVSTEIPQSFQGEIKSNYGSFGTTNTLARFGDDFKNVGYVIEYMKNKSDGFKNLDGPGNTGFDRNDITAKIRVNTNPDAKVYQSLELKLQYSDEDSNETYLGLSQDDFEANPFGRYAGSQVDNMQTTHRQIMLTHLVKFSKNMTITTSFYNNEFARNWFKLDRVVDDASTVSISNILENPSNFPLAFSYINGATSPNDALRVKNNNREYYSRGIQTKFDYHFYTNDVYHDIEVGVRLHSDEEDRFQWFDDFGMSDGIMKLTTAGIPGTDSNRISGADAFSAHLLYKLKFNKFRITPGIRYENVELTRIDYGTTDVEREGTNISAIANSFQQFIPGIGVNYTFNTSISLFAGLHKGFSPAGFRENQEPEESTNFEIGTRFNHNRFSGEVIGFYNDYSNMLGSDLAATGGVDGNLDLFNAGEVDVSGVEVQLAYELLNKSNQSLPIQFNYTYTDTEFKTDFSSPVGIWGDVEAGDELPYIPKHQFNLSIGYNYKAIDFNLNARYRDEFRTQAGTGSIADNNRVESLFLIDFSAGYQLNQNFKLTMNVINMLDNTYLAARVPSGLRPGHPFGVYGGFHLKF